MMLPPNAAFQPRSLLSFWIPYIFCLFSLTSTIHDCVLRLSLGTLWSSPVVSLYTKSGQPSCILHFCLYEVVLHFTKFSLQAICSSFSFPYLLLTMPYISLGWCLPPVIALLFLVQPNTPPSVLLKYIFLIHLNQTSLHISNHSSRTHVYTNGSKSISETGFAVVLLSHTYNVPLLLNQASLQQTYILFA